MLCWRLQIISLLQVWSQVEKLLKLQISEDLKQVLYGNWSTLGIDIKGNELENDYVNKLKELGIVQVDVWQDCARIFTAE